MKLTKRNLLDTMNLADEILEYSNMDKEVVIEGELIDLNLWIFNPIEPSPP